MTEYEELLKELRKVSRVLLLANAKLIESELAKIATTNERKKMWVLIDGIRMPKEIADMVKVTQMAVSYFLSAAVSAGFVEYIRGEPPRRALDYVPAAWIDLVKLPEATAMTETTIGQATIDVQKEQAPSEAQQ